MYQITTSDEAMQFVRGTIDEANRTASLLRSSGYEQVQVSEIIPFVSKKNRDAFNRRYSKYCSTASH